MAGRAPFGLPAAGLGIGRLGDDAARRQRGDEQRRAEDEADQRV
jgi:hypothetical protein